jgi:hypothetical protein
MPQTNSAIEALPRLNLKSIGASLLFAFFLTIHFLVPSGISVVEAKTVQKKPLMQKSPLYGNSVTPPETLSVEPV